MSSRQVYDDFEKRMVLICKPEQSGKTFIMIQEIIQGLQEPKDEKIIINIIFCDNNLLLTRQTTERINDNISEEFVDINGISYLEFSSHSRTKYKNADSVGYAITTKDVRNILCCTNGTRVDDIAKIISEINSSTIFPGLDKFIFKIWLDEADKFISYINNTFKPLIEKYKNVYLKCITATSKKLFDEYKVINVFPLENTTTNNYHGWNDNIKRLIDHKGNCIEFASHVINNIANDLLVSGTKWLVPSSYTKESHNDMKDIFIRLGAAVIIVNGDGITIYFPNLEIIKTKKEDQLKDILINMYVKYNLNLYPLVITGNICISRGISINSPEFMIDYHILSECSNQQEASQISGRSKGNMKDWPNYKKPIVFTSLKFDKIAEEWENKSRKLATLAYDKNHQGKSTLISKCEYKTLGENYEILENKELIKTYTQAIKLLKTKQIQMGHKIKPMKKR